MTDPLELLPDQRIAHIVAADTADAILRRAGHGPLAGSDGGRSRRRRDHRHVHRLIRARHRRAGDGRRHVRPSGDARERREAAQSYGYTIVEPEFGPLASGQVGRGRLAEHRADIRAVIEALGGPADPPARPALRPPSDRSRRPRDLAGWHVVVTAGGTAEPIDPVRYIGNRSTGKMGVAIAEAALARGARVTLIRGMSQCPLPEAALSSTHRPPPRCARRCWTRSRPPTRWSWPRPLPTSGRSSRPPARSLAGDGLTLELEPTADILAEASESLTRQRRIGQLLVGFAAETGSLERARAKAERKGVDLLVANDVAEAGSGFGTDTNRVTIFVPGAAPDPWPLMSKTQVADRLLDRVDRPSRGRRGAELAATMSATEPTALTASRPACHRRRHRKMHVDGERIPMLTAYDYPTARIVDEAGIPLILVGDSLGMVMLGYEETVRVTMDEMLHHTKAVVRGTQAGTGRRRHAVPVLRHCPKKRSTTPAASSARPAPAPSRSRAASARRGPSRRSCAPASRFMGHIGWTPQSSTAWAARLASRASARAGARLAGRRVRGPRSRRLLGRPGAGARAARRGNH